MPLLSANDLVAAEAKYHSSCRTSFENSQPSKSTPGRPTSEGKMISFLTMCLKLENEMDLYTLTEFHEAMKKLVKEVYSVKMTKIKLFEKYGSSIRFVNRRNRSDIILLENLSCIILK